MRTEIFIFDGIKRAGGPQNAGNGACDDYQNLRFEYGSARAVRDFTKLIPTYSDRVKAYEHRIGHVTNILNVTLNNGSDYLEYDTYENGEKTGSGTVDSFVDGARNSIDVASIGNILIVKCDEYNVIGGGRIRCWLWKDGKYNDWYKGQLPELPLFIVTKGEVSVLEDSLTIPASDNPSVNTMYGYAASSYNRLCHNEDKELSEGYVLICVNYTLFDGSETKPSQPVLVQIGGVAEEAQQSPGGSTGSGFTVDARYVIRFSNESGTISVSTKIGVQGVSVRLDGTNLNDSFYQANKDLIKSINIYSTYPHSIYDLEESMSTFRQYLDSVIDGDAKVFMYGAFGNTSSSAQSTLYSRMSMSSMEFLKDAVFYKQESIVLTEDISEMTKDVQLRFDESLLSSERMKVDSSGYIQYSGKIMSFNNRVHVYDISAIFNTPNILWGTNLSDYADPSPTSLTTDSDDSSAVTRAREPEGGFDDNYDDAGTGTATVHCLVYLKNGNSDIITYHSFNAEYNGKIILPFFISYPDSRAYKAEFYFTNSSGTKYKGVLSLKSSDTYNFSYSSAEPAIGRGSDGDNSILVGVNEYFGDIPTSASARPEYSSPGQMVVSGQGNPAYFAPENSYSFQGEIRAVVPLTDTVSEAQFGQFPLAIFTTEGIWTLEQGGGEVLYSRSVKISNLSCSGDVIQTKTGIYFTADGGVWRLSGRNTERISALMEGDTDAYVEECGAYAGCCMSDVAVNVPVKPPLHKVVSSSPTLAYDSCNDELYVGYVSSEVEFSYVYSAKTGLWRSDTRRILHQSGGVAVLSAAGNWQDRTGKIVRMDTEDEEDTGLRQVLIRTRPFLAGADCYKTVHRMIARCMADAGEYSLTDGKNTSGMLSMYLFGSDNLSDWTLIGGVQRDGVIDRLPIMKTAGSWRYLVVAIAGYMKAGGTISGIDMMIEDKYGGKIR